MDYRIDPGDFNFVTRGWYAWCCPASARTLLVRGAAPRDIRVIAAEEVGRYQLNQAGNWVSERRRRRYGSMPKAPMLAAVNSPPNEKAYWPGARGAVGVNSKPRAATSPFLVNLKLGSP